MFRAQSAHHQEVNDVNCTYAASGIVTLCKWPSCATAKEEVILWCTAKQISRSLGLCSWAVHRESISIVGQQDATIYSLLYFCKLIYMFWVVTPPIFRSTYNCNYSIWHWSNRLCYLALSWSSWDFRDGLTSTRCCNYSYICSWRWVELPPKTCRSVYRNIINCI